MRALVTGATGFIGSHIADTLYRRGFDVRCTYRSSSNLRWLKDKPYELIETTLFDFESLSEAVKNVDYIFHSGGQIAARNYDEYLKANRDGSLNLFKAAIANAPALKRFVYISSQTVAGPSQSLSQPYKESDLCHPITVYAKSKREAEIELLKLQKELPLTIIRPSAVIGPRDTAILPLFNLGSKGILVLIGMGKKFLNLIHVKDLAESTVDAALSSNTTGNIYFIASEQPYSWNEIMDCIKKISKRKFSLKVKLPHFFVLSAAGAFQLYCKIINKVHPFNLDKGRDFIQKYWTCSVVQAKKDFGFCQKMSLEESLADTVNWYKENKWI